MKKIDVRYKFGDKLRAVRERKKITLRAVSKAAGVSESLVSQIERNKVSPSIDTLLTIADVLEIDPEYLFRDFKKNKKVSLIRKLEWNTFIQEKVTYHQLAGFADGEKEHALGAFLLEIPKGAEKGGREFGHTGKELGIILKGAGELVYGTETYDLKEGDSISFPADIPHILRNTGEETLKAIWVITPPRMLFSYNK